MERELYPDLAKAIIRLNRAMSDLADIHGAIGFGLGRALESGVRNVDALAMREMSNPRLDRVLDYFAAMPPTANRERAIIRALEASFPKR